VVGWYKNATVYRDQVIAHFRNEKVEYSCEAKSSDVTLVPAIKRTCVFLTKEVFGQASVRYPNAIPQIKKKVLEYINDYDKDDDDDDNDNVYNGNSVIHIDRHFIDTKSKLEIERTAVDKTTQYYKNQGYQVTSVEKERRLGYDLIVSKKNKQIYVEVKGRQVPDILFELTHHEYNCIKRSFEKRQPYQIAVVTGCLNKPKLKIFSTTFDDDINSFVGVNIKNKKEKIQLHELTFARGRLIY
jgi:hypothetical protein